MRGALVCLLAAGLALGGALVSASGAATERLAVAKAAIAATGASSFGAVESRAGGSDQVTTEVAAGSVTVARGEAAVRTEGPDGSASVSARGVDVLDGRVTADTVQRSASTSGATTGAVTGLVVDGVPVGDVSEERTIPLTGGGRVVVNRESTGLRVVTSSRDVRVAIVRTSTFKRRVEPTPTPTPTPEPTRSPKPTRTPKPAKTAAPEKQDKVKRRKAPEVPKRLSAGGYAFPVYGDITYEDTYGAARAAPVVSHQGTDIFAPFGSPVVAVRDGRLTKVGTLPISGNRLWLIDEAGDAFFYAHLSSFSAAARNGARVQAGDVLGFVGNTGDAEPTPPHVHFEVHPGGIEEDPVNPYPILLAWEEREDVPPGAWLQEHGAEAADRPGALVTVRDFIAE